MEAVLHTRVLIAPATFKGTMPAPEAAEAMIAVLHEAFGDALAVDCCPVADGGDDTLAVLLQAQPDFEPLTFTVTGPVAGRKVRAQALWLPAQKLAVVEAAQAHGLKLLDRPAPLQATSYGVGELIRRLIERHADLQTVVVTVGGSASTDGGLGALQALGVRFYDARSKRLPAPFCAADLTKVHAVEFPDPWPFAGQILVATDVLNPLLGRDGTAAVFAPQKGATPSQCRMLEQELARISELMARTTGVDLAMMPGMGAAGGLAFGLRQLPRTALLSGSQWVSEFLQLEARIQAADGILTGEGRLDATSLGGKATGHLLLRAAGKPVFIFCGQVQAGLAFPDNVHIVPLAENPENLDAAMHQPARMLQARLRESLPLLRETLGL